MAKYCELLVDKATQRMETIDAFADWEKDKSKGNRPLSDAERLRLNDLEKEVARLVHMASTQSTLPVHWYPDWTTRPRRR